ncbi:serine hydrolase [Ideonella sp.]|jgi:CubicO group peptidase (beta-lactamase class C family)|uniref:serine hydrolase n=1 Tax=Ideonella sp. TaxID=1929293 RepID=UPI0037C0C8E7
MRFSIAVLALAVFLGCPAHAANDAQAAPLVEQQIQRVEAALPAVSKEGRTLELSLAGWMKALRVPGLSIAVIEDYRIVWAKGYGVMAADAGDAPVTTATLFQAGSVSKPIAALAVLREVESERFDLDADVNSYLRSWKLPDADPSSKGKVTLRDLLGHTAGITPGGFAGYSRDASLPTMQQILEGVPPASNRAARRASAPGAAVSYSGLGYTILQLALMERLGKPFEDIIKASVFDPVGMRDSTFQSKLPDALAARAARGHRTSGEAIPGGWYVHPESAAAGLWTTASDLALLWTEVAKSSAGRSDRLLSRDKTREMLSQHRDQMGLGFVVRPGEAHGRFAHFGGNQGYRSHVEMFTSTGQGIVVMTNSDAGQLLTALLVRRVAQVHGWPVTEQRPLSLASTDAIFAQVDQARSARTRVNVEERLLKRYVGRYELAPGLEFEVTLAAGHLEVRLGDQPRFPAYAESEAKFYFEVVDAQISFVLTDEGRVSALILHQGGRDQRAKRIE